MTVRSFGGMISPVDRIFKQRMYGIAIRYTTTAEGRFSWNKMNVLIDNKRFSMYDIRTVVHGLHETARRRLYKELFFVAWDAMPSIQIAMLADNLVEMSEGWRFWPIHA
ncbi:hypothetical protein LTR53_017647, partial [Teratosphaeriaceae sp. CCFEE 6253]